MEGTPLCRVSKTPIAWQGELSVTGSGLQYEYYGWLFGDQGEDPNIFSKGLFVQLGGNPTVEGVCPYPLAEYLYFFYAFTFRGCCLPRGFYIDGVQVYALIHRLEVFRHIINAWFEEWICHHLSSTLMLVGWLVLLCLADRVWSPRVVFRSSESWNERMREEVKPPDPPPV